MEAVGVVSGPNGSEHERGWVCNPLIINKIQIKSESTWIRRICYQRFKSQIFLFQQNPSSDSLLGEVTEVVFFYMRECHENFRKIMDGLEVEGVQ